MHSAQRWTGLSSSPVHFPPPASLSRFRKAPSSFLSPRATQRATYPPLLATPAPGAPAADLGGPFRHGKPRPPERDPLLSPGGSGYRSAPAAGLRPGHLQGLAGARASRARAGTALAPPPPHPPGGLQRPVRRPPPRFRASCGVRAPPPPHTHTAAHPGPGQSCVGETAQRVRAGGGGRRERKAERAQHRFGLRHPPRRAQQPAPRTRRRRRRACLPPTQPWGRPLSLVPAQAAQLSQSSQGPPAPHSPRPLAFLLNPFVMGQIFKPTGPGE